MNGASCSRPADEGLAGEPAGDPPGDGAGVAERIGLAALELARRAQAAGLTTLGRLLESAALEAGSEAATRRWPGDGAQD
jgi:hypothetical protein